MPPPVRLSHPRIPTLPEAQWSEEQRSLISSKHNTLGPLNIFKTLIRQPALYKRFNQFANQVLFKSSLSPREREMVVLRVACLCRSAYEFRQHTSIGMAAGLDGLKIARIEVGPRAPGWSSDDALLLEAVDELHCEHFLSDAIWQQLSTRYSTEQLMDFVFLVGNYTMLAMALNSFGVQIEDSISPEVQACS